MINIKTISEGFEFLVSKNRPDLIGKYQVKNSNKATDSLSPLLFSNQERSIPLLYWRNERRFKEMRGLTKDGTLVDISAMRSCFISHRNENINKLLFRELDLAEWLNDSKIEYIFALQNKNVTNLVLHLENGVICTIEVASTLAKNAQTIDKHEIIAGKGVAVDKVVDTQVNQNSVYLFSDEELDAYTDTDYELYGLSTEEVAIVRSAFDTATTEETRRSYIKQHERLNKLLSVSLESVKTNKRLKAEV